ncbi:hypothetical protein PFISCL1PPCAC_622, partial [Pristionchus fissidentatus]
DQVIVMKEGEVIERGGYDELRTEPNGIFAKMIREQEVERRKSRDENEEESEDSFEEMDVEVTDEEIIYEKIREDDFPSIKGGFLTLLLRHKFKTFVVILLGILKGIANPLLSARYFFVIGSLEEDNYETLLIWLVVGTMSVGIYHFIVQFISHPICQYIGETVMNDLRVSSLRSLLNRPISYFDRSSSSPSSCSLLLSQQSPMATALIDHKLSVVVDGFFS